MTGTSGPLGGGERPCMPGPMGAANAAAAHSPREGDEKAYPGRPRADGENGLRRDRRHYAKIVIHPDQIEQDACRRTAYDA